MDNYIRIHFAENKQVLTLMSLKSIAKKLPSTEFVRIHRSYIIPLSKIDKIGSKKIEIRGMKIPVGISYADEFLKLWKLYLDI